MSKSGTGALSALRYCEEVGYRIDAEDGRPVFWGTVSGGPLLAADYGAFADWLRDRDWCLVWCALSERRASKGYDFTAAEVHQSAVVVLHPGMRPVELVAKRAEWLHERARK